MKKFIILVFVVLLSQSACVRDSNERIRASAGRGDMAPGFILADLSGKNVSLRDLSGKVVLLEFWATWCPPCKASVPDLIRLQDKYKDKDVAVLAVSVDEGTGVASRLSDFYRENKINYRILIGTDEVAKAYNVKSIPAIFLIDRSGVIRGFHLGYTGDLIGSFSDEIDRLL